MKGKIAAFYGTTMVDAASELGITRSTLYRRMERFGLKPGRVVRRD